MSWKRAPASVVAISRIEGNDLDSVCTAVSRALELCPTWSSLIPRGARVFLKPNLSSAETFHTTNPLVTASLVRLVYRAGAGEVLVGDSAVVGSDMEEILHVTGTRQACEKEGARVLDLKGQERTIVEVPGGECHRRVEVFLPVLQADVLINVPLLKTGPGLGISVAMKNLKGILSDADKKAFHRSGIVASVCDLNRAIRPHLTVVDGMQACEMMLRPVPMGIILAGADPVSVDAVAAGVMGHRPHDIRILRHAADTGLGEIRLSRIRIEGAPIASVRRRVLVPSENLAELSSYFCPGLPEGKIRIREGKACSGCMVQCLATLDRLMREEPEVLDAYERLTMLIGSGARLPKRIDGVKMIFVGNCTKDLVPDGVDYVKGCPPWSRDIIQTIREGRGTPAPPLGKRT